VEKTEKTSLRPGKEKRPKKESKKEGKKKKGERGGMTGLVSELWRKKEKPMPSISANGQEKAESS